MLFSLTFCLYCLYCPPPPLQACLAFFNLVLFSGELERGVVPIDADDFLQTLRYAALSWR